VTVHDLVVVAFALGGAVCYAVSNVLEQRKAAAAPPETTLRIALFVHLARQPAWWLGIAADVGGFVCEAVALALGSLVFVQPLLVTSLIFSLALGGIVARHRLARNDALAAIALMAGLATFLVVAAPSGGVDQLPARDWVTPGLVLAASIGAVVVVASRLAGTTRAALLGLAAGATFGVTASLTKTFAHLVGSAGVVVALSTWEPYALALLTAFGFLLVQSSFQAGDLRASLPALETTQPIVGSLVGVLLMHEQLHATGLLGQGALAATIVAMVWSAVVLAQSAAADQLEPTRRSELGEAGCPAG
jgi:drug/metabolite transporter (DMT)-like permease